VDGLLASRQEELSARAHNRRLVADIIQAAGADRVVTMDLHAVSCRASSASRRPHDGLSMIADYFKMKGLDDMVIVSPMPAA